MTLETYKNISAYLDTNKVSVTKFTGAVSTIIKSYSFLTSSNKSSTFELNKSSAGLGGITPDAIMSKPLISGIENFTSFKEIASFVIKLVIPFRSGIPKYSVTLGAQGPYLITILFY